MYQTDSICIVTEFRVDDPDGFTFEALRDAIVERLGLEVEGDTFRVYLEDFTGEEVAVDVETCGSWADTSDAMEKERDAARAYARELEDRITSMQQAIDRLSASLNKQMGY